MDSWRKLLATIISHSSVRHRSQAAVFHKMPIGHWIGKVGTRKGENLSGENHEST